MKRLHLGCGKRDFGKDWVHIDKGNFPHVTSHDVTKLPFKDNTFDLIYSSHILEYFDREQVIGILKEWRRVLKVGCTLRIAVPDFGKVAKLYIEEGHNLQTFLGLLYGKMKVDDDTIYHKTVYDFESLTEVLRCCGFINIHKYDWKKIPPHDIHDDHSQAYIPSKNFEVTEKEPYDKENGTLISLNVECIVPCKGEQDG